MKYDLTNKTIIVTGVKTTAKANNNAYNRETWKKLWDVTQSLAKVTVQ